MGGDEERLRRGYYGDNENLNHVSKWKGVVVEGGRVTRLEWDREGLSDTLPIDISAFLALTYLYLSNNTLSVELPSELGNLTSLTFLVLNDNNSSGSRPLELGDLRPLIVLLLNNNFTNYVPPSDIIPPPPRKNQDLWFLRHC